MNKNYLKRKLSLILLKSRFFIFIFSCAYATVSAQTSTTLQPLADAFVRNGSYAAINYGNDPSLTVRGTSSSGYIRRSYLKFSLNGLSNINSAKLRIYGRNTENTLAINVDVYGIGSDSWTESGITWNNSPTTTSAPLSSTGVNDQLKYYEFDVTDYVITQSGGDKVVSLLLRNTTTQEKNVVFNSRQNSQNSPQLVITTSSSTSTPPPPTGTSSKSTALLFVENMDKFPANDYFVASKVQTPWSRDKRTYNANHDSLTVRVHNKGIDPLVVKNLVLSSTSRWKIQKLKGATYVPGSGLPISISSGAYADITVRFIAVNQSTRVKVLHDTLTISSNDSKSASKLVFLNGLWQNKGEGNNEPYAQEVLNAFGYKTSTGFSHTDPDRGAPTKLKGSEVRPSYFIRADMSRPVSIRQIGSYHGCCTQTEKIAWNIKGSGIFTTVFTHLAKDAQSLLPRKNSTISPAEGTFSTSSSFALKIGGDNTDASKNPGGKTGTRVWKALDAKGNIIPNSYIISNDYLGSEFTNYDYNDNMYLVRNVKPEKGTAFYSALKATSSALDFGEKILKSDNSLTLNLSSLGKTYTDGSKDPAITISSVVITGENKSEFIVSTPAKTTLNPQESTTLAVNFKPLSQGLKISDLLIYYNNSASPLRVPLYGIAKASGVTVKANYRINSGSSSSITINGKTWSADNQYAHDNLEPYTNTNLTQIAGTDEDALYLKEQSSDGEKKPFRYEFPVSNGDYVVRLHFAELYWGGPGSGINGGAGSRVMSVSLENKRLINLDVTQEVGTATALVKNQLVTVTDGKLNINFSSTVDRPMVVAVEVYSFRASSAKPVDTSESIVSGFENKLKKVTVYPNPLQKTLNIQFPANYTGNANMQIIDAAGRIYEIGKMKLQPGGSNTAVDISRLSLKPGFYYLKILSETRPAEVIKLIVP